jgi:hypothetical protein
MGLSNYFTLQELTSSNTAIRKGIDNTPSPEVVENLKQLCIDLLDPIRVGVQKPVRVSSGFRCEKLNKLLGGAKNSQHIYGEAADIQVDGMSTEELFQFIKDHFNYDQLIQEFDSWVHISYRKGKNRNQNLRAVKKNGKTVYLPA